MAYISRAQWGARPPSRDIYLTTWGTRDGFVVHYAGFALGSNAAATVRGIQNNDMDNRGYADIGYNELVDPRTGDRYEGRARGPLAIGAHSGGNNTGNFGICMLGQDIDVSIAAKAAIRARYDELCALAGRRLAMRYHGQLNSTSCPGDQLRAWVQAGMPAPTGGDDMSQRIEDMIEWEIRPWTGGALQASGRIEQELAAQRAMLTAIAGKVDLDTAELEAVAEAARAGAASATESIVAAILAQLPAMQDEHLRAQVEAAVRSVLGGLDEPAAEQAG